MRAPGGRARRDRAPVGTGRWHKTLAILSRKRPERASEGQEEHCPTWAVLEELARQRPKGRCTGDAAW